MPTTSGDPNSAGQQVLDAVSGGVGDFFSGIWHTVTTPSQWLNSAEKAANPLTLLSSQWRIIDDVYHGNIDAAIRAGVPLALTAALAATGAGAAGAAGDAADGLAAGATTAAEGADAAATTAGRDLAESCLNSFTADTPVLMANGKEEPIADVKVGDKVLATDPETGRTEVRPVTALIRHSGKHTMVDLTLDDGSKITTTDHHPFWDATTSTFTNAIDLPLGDRVLSDHGRTLTISTEHVYDRNLTAYNLQIDGIHTYYAGSTPVLVHNSCSGFRGTNMSDEESFNFHYGKHSGGVSPEQYAQDAQAWAANPSGAGTSVRLADGTQGMRYRTPGGGPGGILDGNGNIITFWYR